jgi:hypothetical protein
LGEVTAVPGRVREQLLDDACGAANDDALKITTNKPRVASDVLIRR